MSKGWNENVKVSKPKKLTNAQHDKKYKDRYNNAESLIYDIMSIVVRDGGKPMIHKASNTMTCSHKVIREWILDYYKSK